MRRFELRDLAPPWRWGIFRWHLCNGRFIERNAIAPKAMMAIYTALKEIGFRETRWQVLYPGQIGGLIRSRRGSLLEIHVRFFRQNMVYAELEIGRSTLLHFLIEPRFANNYVISLLAHKLPMRDLAYLHKAIDAYKATSRKGWLEWRTEGKLMTPSLKRQIKLSYVFGDWRALMIAMLLSVAAAFADDAAEIALAAFVMILLYLIAPKRS